MSQEKQNEVPESRQCKILRMDNLQKYHYRKLNGLCVQCGLKRPVKKILRCSQCRIKRAAISAGQRGRRPLGSCQSCYKRKARNGLSLCIRCSELSKIRSKRRHAEIRKKALDKYGGACACCKENNIKYLQIDHVDGGGNKERQRLGNKGRGNRFFTILVQSKKRKDIQILCANCHQAKKYGGCNSEDHL